MDIDRASVKTPPSAAAMEWPALSVEKRSVSELVPSAKNARKHTTEQIQQIANSIKQWGWTIPILIDEDSGVIAGHGRIMAAELLQIGEVPVMIARGWTDEQKRAYMIADNQLALNSSWDETTLGLELSKLRASSFELGLLGIKYPTMRDLLMGDIKDSKATRDDGVNVDRFIILVTCKSERAQEELLAELTERDFECKIS